MNRIRRTTMTTTMAKIMTGTATPTAMAVEFEVSPTGERIHKLVYIHIIPLP